MYMLEKYNKALADYKTASIMVEVATQYCLHLGSVGSVDLDALEQIEPNAAQNMSNWAYIKDCSTRLGPYTKAHCSFCPHRIACLCTD